MDKELKQYYKTKQRGGRNTAARMVDIVAMTLLFAAASFLWFRYTLNSPFAIAAFTLITTACFVLATLLLNRILFEKFITKEQERLKLQVLSERLVLLPKSGFVSLCEKAASSETDIEGAYISHMQKIAPLTEDDILSVFHDAHKTRKTPLVLCTLAPLTPAATELFCRLPIRTVLISRQGIIDKACETEGYAVTIEDVDAYIHGTMAARKELKKNAQSQPFIAANAKKYLLLGLFLLALSFFGGYALYYRMLAGLCFSLSTVTFFMHRPIFAPPSTDVSQ